MKSSAITRIIASVLLCAAFTLPAAVTFADGSEPLLNRVSFAVDVSEEVDNDVIVVQFFSEHQSPAQAQSANRVNEDMTWAVEVARAVPGIDVTTPGYRTNPVYDKGRIRAWQTRQSLRLESKDFDAVTGLVATLQERLGVESMGYQVSTERRKAVEARLVDDAIRHFGERAAAVTASFGRQSYSLVDASVGTHGARPPPIAFRGRAMAMEAADVAQPAIAAGQQTVQVTVNGTIELSAD